MKPLRTENLNGMGCDTPNCSHNHSELYLSPRCHPAAGCDVRYVKADGTLHISCTKCDKPIVEIAVAGGG